MKTFREIIDLFKVKKELAVTLGVTPQSIDNWWARDSIPPGRWNAVVAACAKSGSKLTVQDLANIAEKRVS